MWRFRFPTLFGLLAGALVPVSAFAQERSLFGPIIPQEGPCVCAGSAPSWGCVLDVLQNLINIGIALAIVFVVLVIAYAGFMLITSGSSPGRRTQARTLVGNAVFGLFIVLIAWLAIDFLMKAVYNPAATLSGGQALGPWNAILASREDSMCLEVKNPVPITSGFLDIILGQPGAYQPPIAGVGACSANNILSAAARGGISMSTIEANHLACFAGPESQCGTQMQNYNWNRGSSAYGPFQILLDGNSRCFNNSVCSQAAGIQGPLNCSTGFRNGNPIPGSPVVERCKRAAANLVCSTVAAHCVYQAQGPGAWTNNRDSTAAHQSCVR